MNAAETISGPTKTSLRPSLLQMECHFTWRLLKEDADLDDLEDRLYDQIEFVVTKHKSMIYNLLAFVKHLKGNNEEAIESFQKAVECVQKNQADEFNRKSIVAYGNLAWVYYHMNNLDDAQTYTNKVEMACKELSSTFRFKVHLAETYGEQGWSYLKFAGKYYEKAKDCFEKALALEPEEPEWNSGYATAVYRLEGFFNTSFPSGAGESVGLLKRAVKLNPEDTVVMALLALKLQDIKQDEEGEKYMVEALEKTPDLPYVLRYAAKFYRRRGQPDESLKLLKQALNLTPTSGFLHHQIGLCYRKKFIDMKKESQSSRSRYPSTGSSEQREELIRNAIYHFELVLEQKTKFVYAHFDLASMYAEANQHEKAADTFKKVLSMKNLTPKEKRQALTHFARYHEYHTKSEKEALKLYKQALMIPGESHDKSWCKNSMKKLAEKIIKNNPSDATAFGALAIVHQHDGEKMQAIECFERALQLDPDNEDYLSGLCDMRLSI